MENTKTLEEMLQSLVGMSYKECLNERDKFMKKLNSLPTRYSEELVQFPKIADIVMGI